MLEERAMKFAMRSHCNQFRVDGVTPYIEHPRAVVSLLKDIEVTDQDILSAAWLHDVIEDCGVDRETLEREFNSNIARLVAALTRDVDKEAYRHRIMNADYAVQIIKLADVVHNCSDIGSQVTKQMIKNKVEDCKKLYLDLARKLHMPFYERLERYVREYT